ncbi:hypothetical protein [Treponema zioleckii]|uniref:hypothetical protein n=1 Tax=Treponema zioleckii TaxID=331680 RepID=UPI00168AAEB7|nr:hypothetical protein [Treponema zioleckii]
MKHKLAKIILALQIAIYAIGFAAFLLGRLDGIHYGFEGGQLVESDSAFLKTLGHIGDTANAVFMYTVIFGGFILLAFAVVGVVFSLLARRERLAKTCLFVSLFNLLVCGMILHWIVGISNEWGYPKPSPVYNLTWHLLDDSIQGEKIILTLTADDFSTSEPQKIEKKKNVVAGKTKKIRLPDEDFTKVEGVSKSDENVRVFVPYGFFINWREDLDKYVKRDSYEIIVYKKPEITEDEEKFVMENVPHDAVFELCYWDKDLRKFVHIASSDGVFYKKDRSEELLLDSEKEYPDSDEQYNLFMSVKSAVYADETYLITLSYERDKSFLPVKNIRTYIQDGREIKAENVELNGTQWIKTQYVSKTGEPIANVEAEIFVFGDDIKDGIIHAKTDSDGYLWVEHIPDGVDCYVMLGD